jgi:hypothetical protein
MRTTNGIRASALRSLRLLLLISAPFASARAASPVQDGAPPASFEAHNVVLGKLPMLWDPATALVSEDSQHVAFVVRHAQGSAVWQDGVEGKVYKRITSLLFSRVGARLAYVATKAADLDVVVLDGKEFAAHKSVSPYHFKFSPDGTRTAYAFATQSTNEDQTWSPMAVAVDGKVGREYPGLLGTGNLLFSPDSKHLAYLGVMRSTNQAGQQSCVVRDGMESELYDELLPGGMVFSADSRHLAFAARRNGKWYTVLDGEPSRTYDKIAAHSLAFSPDSQRLVYRAEREGKRFLVVAGEETCPAGTDDFDGSCFSPDSQRMAIHVLRGGKVQWLVDKVAGPEFDAVGDLSFSPDSRRTIYGGRRGDQWHLVLDGAESRAYDLIGGSTIQFSPDSHHAVCIARRQGSYRLVSDLQEGPEYDWAGGTLVFSPDSRHTAFVAGRGRKDFAKPDQVFIVVDGREGPPYSEIMGKLAFDGGRTVHAIGLRMNAQTFEDEIVRIEMVLSANSSGPEETR